MAVAADGVEADGAAVDGEAVDGEGVATAATDMDMGSDACIV